MPRKFLLLLPLILLNAVAFGQNGPDTCNKSNNETLFSVPSADQYASTIIATADGGYLLVGYSNAFGIGGFDGYVIKENSLGQVMWQKAYGGSGDDEFTQARQTSDGGYILGGYTTSYGDPAGDAWVVKIDGVGTLQWSKRYGDGNPWGDRLFDLIPTSDGGYAFVGDHKYIPGIVDAMLVKLDANGNVLWAKGFDSGGSDECPGIAEDHDSLVVAAFYQSGTGYDAAFMKIEETSGNIAWLKSWDFDNRTNRIGTIWLLPDGYEIYGVNSDGYGVTNPWQNITKTDFNGNIIFDRELHTSAPDQTMNGSVHPTADGGYVVENFDLPWNPNSDIYITKVRNDGSIDWSRTYLQPGPQSPGGIVPTADGGYAALASSTQGTPNWGILTIKTDSVGMISGACTSTAATAYNRNPAITNLAYNWSSVYDIAFNTPFAINLTDTVASSGNSILCLTITYCKHLKLSGEDSVCGLDSLVTYHSIRDSGCVDPIQWSIDTAFASVVTQTDSTIQLQYKQSGATKLFGKLLSACGLLQDSLPVAVIHVTPVFLGDDTAFCAGGSVVLNAGSGFQAYTWSTGAATQQVTASTSGTYWVAAQNPNGSCLSKDTIDITVYPNPVVNLGPDKSICKDSVYIFEAGNGFSSYLWQDGSTNSIYDATQAGIYWVKVTDANNCTTADTARILSVQAPPSDFLAATAEICSKGQLPIQISAIGHWSRYLWSDSATGPAITITTPGVYWLEVATSAGCAARDTITVSPKQCPFGIFFPNAFTPNNDGRNDVFRPIVYTLISKFYMAVYNRWGVRVFETNDPGRGWDGMLNGQAQPSGAYVWYAQYILQTGNGQEITEKGTLMLVR